MQEAVKDVFLDVCTQRDYLAADGKRPVCNAGAVCENVKHLMALARWAKIPTVSCVEIQDFEKVRGMQNPTCLAGTNGQTKVPGSILPRNVVVDSDNFLCISLDLFERYQQAILTKTHRDPFANPKLDRLLTELPATRFILFGVSLESTLRLLALGLLLRHRRVALVSDACAYWNDADAQMTLRQMEAKGCELIPTHTFVRSTFETLRSRNPRIRRRFVA